MACKPSPTPTLYQDAAAGILDKKGLLLYEEELDRFRKGRVQGGVYNWSDSYSRSIRPLLEANDPLHARNPARTPATLPQVRQSIDEVTQNQTYEPRQRPDPIRPTGPAYSPTSLPASLVERIYASGSRYIQGTATPESRARLVDAYKITETALRLYGIRNETEIRRLQAEYFTLMANRADPRARREYEALAEIAHAMLEER